MPLDLTKPVQTRDERPATYLCTLNTQPSEARKFVFTVERRDCTQYIVTVDTDGCVYPKTSSYYNNFHDDIFNAPHKKTLYFSVFLTVSEKIQASPFVVTFDSIADRNTYSNMYYSSFKLIETFEREITLPS